MLRLLDAASRGGLDNEADIGRIVSNVVAAGFAQGTSLITSQPGNARTLINTTSRLLARVVRAETAQHFATAPVEVTDWQGASDTDATLGASNVRSILVEKDSLLRLATVSVSAATAFLVRIVRGVMRPSPVPTPIPGLQQTELNLMFQPADLWRSALGSVAKTLPELVLADPDFVDIVVLSWLMIRIGESDGHQLDETSDAYWRADRSGIWWFEFRGSSPYRDITDAGLRAIGRALRAGDCRQFERFVDQARSARWEGLAALAIEVAGKACRDERVPSPAKRRVAERAAQQLRERGALAGHSIQRALRDSLSALLRNVSGDLRSNIIALLEDYVSPARIAGIPVPIEPSLDEVRTKHETLLAELTAKQSDSVDRFPSRDALRIQLLRQRTPEAEHSRLVALHRRWVDWKESAERGEVPDDHPDVRFVRAALTGADVTDLSPQLVALASARTTLPERALDETIDDATTSADDDAPPEDPGWRFVRECDEVASERLNARAPLSAEAQLALQERIATTYSLAGVEEPSPAAIREDCEELPAGQPFRKRAWLKLIVTYIEGLPDGQPHALGDEITAAALSLAADSDPTGNDPADLSESSSVRSLAGRALVGFRAHGADQELNAAIGRLASDVAPKVRRGLFDAAPAIARTDPAFYEQLLAVFASKEMDPFILSRSPPRLFRLFHPSLLTPCDGNLAVLVLRLLAMHRDNATLRDPEAVDWGAGKFEDALRNAIAVATSCAVRVPGGACAAMLTEQVRVAPLVARLVLEAVFESLRAGSAHEIEFMRLAEAVQCPLPADGTNEEGAREAIREVIHVGAVFAAALLNLKYIPAMPIALTNERPNVEAFRKSHLWRHRDRLLSKWRTVVTPWLSGAYVVVTQRLASDVVAVLRFEAGLDPGATATVFSELELHRAARYFERRLADQIAELAAYLVLRCDDLRAEQRAALLAVVDALASVGNEQSSQAARLFAARVRGKT